MKAQPMRVFFDSSAFIKRYVQEAGTDTVIGWCDRATEIGLSGIALPEIISAFCRLRREGKVDDSKTFNSNPYCWPTSRTLPFAI